MKLITIQGDVFRADRIDAILLQEDPEMYVEYCGSQDRLYEFDTMDEARAAQLQAVADWKKALE